MNDRERFRRLEELYHEAIDLPPQERDALLSAAQQEDPALGAELRQLLDHADKPDQLGAVVRAHISQASGSDDPAQLGPYRILHRLGEGGMGVVFAAEQEAPLQRRVAVKLVRHGLGRRVLARFEAERATLARMGHPGVAQIYDAGTAPDGRPFFVMELVEGEPITAACDRERLCLRDRITLFCDVCAAVEHAHQKGVLHRDLKPANILVSRHADGLRVKVIDFGIAKWMDDTTALDGLTRTGEVIGTPEYMSPEQTRGTDTDIDTRTDIYSLGVVLYELLTGALPIDRTTLRGAGPAEIARIIEERPPTPPSARVWPASAENAQVATRRGSKPAHLYRALRGDLGQIILMALRKEKQRRYSSVDQFAQDLRGYLEDRPVLARPDSLAYRTAKLIRRHRAPAAAALLLLVGLVAASIISTAMYFRASSAMRESEIQRVSAERMNDSLTTMLGSIDPDFAQGRDVAILRQLLDETARRIDTELADSPEMAARLSLTVGRVYASIGLLDEAEAHLRSSVQFESRRQPVNEPAMSEAALALGTLLQSRGRYDEAETWLRDTVRIRRGRVGVDAPGLAQALTVLADQLETTGGYEEAEALYREALALLDAHPDRQTERADALSGLGTYLMHQNRMGEAERPLRAAVDIRRESSGACQSGLVSPLVSLARWLRWSKRYEEAAERLHEATTVANACDFDAEHPLRLQVMGALANLNQQMGLYDEAERLYRETLELDRRIFGESHSAVATTQNNLGSLLREVGRYAEAIELFDAAAAGYRETLGDDHYWVSIAVYNSARSHLAERRFARAEALLREARRIREIQSETWQMADVDLLLAVCRIERVAAGETSATDTDLSGLESLLTRSIQAVTAHYGSDTERDDIGLEALSRLHELTQ